MDFLKLNEVSFKYPDNDQYAISSLTLHINKGDFLVIGGPSGCGKTTLLKLIKEELMPAGELSGEIIISEEVNKQIGYLFQDPDNQIVMDHVLSEIAFGLENLNLETDEMRQRIAEMVHFFGFEHLLDQDTETLSGGQKQMVNLASILLQKPKVLLLDEPTSQLDPVQAKECIQFLQRLNEEFGMTIIVVEHRLESLFPITDRIILMDNGNIRYKGQPKHVIQSIWKDNNSRFLPFLPSLATLFLNFKPTFNEPEDIPLSVKETQRWLNNFQDLMSIEKSITESYSTESQMTLEAKHLFVKYDKSSDPVLNNLHLTIHENDFLAVVGGNGSGKTTLLKSLAGILKAYKGKVMYHGRKINKKGASSSIGYLPQNPLLCFMHETLEDELGYICMKEGISNKEERINSVIKELGVENIRTKHIHDCSGGEQQKAALATTLIVKPDTLLIDEPTKGLDALSKVNFSLLLNDLHQKGTTIVMVTHDIEFVAKHAHQCAWLFNGAITTKGTVKDVLKGHYFYTTTINKVTQLTTLPTVLTAEEACDSWQIQTPVLY